VHREGAMKHLRAQRPWYAVILASGGLLVSGPAAATDYVLDATTCSADLGGTWNFLQMCIVTNFALAAGDSVTVPPPYRLVLDGTCTNEGELTVEVGGNLSLQSGDTLDNFGSIAISGRFDNLGSVENQDTGTIVNTGTLVNTGEILNTTGTTNHVSNQDGGLLENWGLFRNSFDSTASNSAATWRNRGGAAELAILGGSFTNEDGALLTNVNGALIHLMNGAYLYNEDQGTELINRTLGEISNAGFIINDDDATFESHGTFTNEWIIQNSDDAIFILGGSSNFWNEGFVENWCGGVFVNDGFFDQASSGGFAWIVNYCDGTVENGATGTLNGWFDNFGGSTVNNGTWAPGPTLHGCVHR
jgi:hypothetical protein